MRKYEDVLERYGVVGKGGECLFKKYVTTERPRRAGAWSADPKSGFLLCELSRKPDRVSTTEILRPTPLDPTQPSVLLYSHVSLGSAQQKSSQGLGFAANANFRHQAARFALPMRVWNNVLSANTRKWAPLPATPGGGVWNSAAGFPIPPIPGGCSPM